MRIKQSPKGPQTRHPLHLLKPFSATFIVQNIMGHLLYSIQLAAKANEIRTTVQGSSTVGQSHPVYEGPSSSDRPLHVDSGATDPEDWTSDFILSGHRLAGYFHDTNSVGEEGSREEEDRVQWLTRTLLERSRTGRGIGYEELEDPGAELTRQATSFRQAVAAMEQREEMDLGHLVDDSEEEDEVVEENNTRPEVRGSAPAETFSPERLQGVVRIQNAIANLAAALETTREKFELEGASFEEHIESLADHSLDQSTLDALCECLEERAARGARLTAMSTTVEMMRQAMAAEMMRQVTAASYEGGQAVDV
ncbi:hypothetical protein BT96DRAFT_93349 [Gymnopus androsaceus JB14]|uniref:Uncharacterized protein n=1 Tax=Gymnopus androsaceus JB14 TaxID=1447944 RepID=A0A6A4HH07_9AGAR|nr:hypothetical protein BT96DRAFT_93349 [Gymnopus androsaceus JB14]